MYIYRFVIKSSIAGGVIYYTIEEGLWSSPEESGKLYNKLYSSISPLIQQNLPREMVQEIHTIPSPGVLKTCAASYWNQGVIATVDFVSKLPTHVSNGIEWAQKEITKSSLATNDTSKITEVK
ncbi:uncharacterized protein LOC106647389 [Copidosoma floridanum]|uniref:uncharacterized protein LOC106647389 n=1 Tax=Copidosoma floridanum TaxID=29053 RepID=UPI0006C93D94|nr:uncharacterized protein LOC106647389 [Copidosoma floridanum]